MRLALDPHPDVAHHLDRYVETPNGCWEWTGAKTANGYGSLRTRATGHIYAHRLFYETYIGPIPKGMVIDHAVCNNPGCVNPNHMTVVTQAENARRGQMRRWHGDLKK